MYVGKQDMQKKGRNYIYVVPMFQSKEVFCKRPEDSYILQLILYFDIYFIHVLAESEWEQTQRVHAEKC